MCTLDYLQDVFSPLSPVCLLTGHFLSVQTCLRESDNSNEEDSLSTHSEDRLSEGSWDRVERRDTEVGPLLPLMQLLSPPLFPPSLTWIFRRTSSYSTVFLHGCVCMCLGHKVGTRPHGLPLFQL